MTTVFLDERERAQLAQLSFVPQRKSAGGWVGDRRSARRGTSLEFADYRNYAPGDDLRRLDWNLYARLQRPYLKLYEDEEDLALHIVIDASASMDWPLSEDSPNETTKWDYRPAKQRPTARHHHLRRRLATIRPLPRPR